jgi:hypothetical protein
MKTVRDPGFGAGAESTRRGRAAQLCAARRKVRPSVVRTHGTRMETDLVPRLSQLCPRQATNLPYPFPVGYKTGS